MDLRINDLIPSFSKVATKISNTTDDIASISAQLDYRVKSRRGIDRRLQQITTELQSMERKMQKLVSFLQESMDEYSTAEEQIAKQVNQYVEKIGVGKKSKEKGFFDKILDGVQVGLDVVGLIPVVGEIADGVNGSIYLARGDKLNAALSFAAMIPVVGSAATGAKYVNKGLKYGEEIADAGKSAKNLGDEVPPAFRQTEFASSYESRLNQTPALNNTKVHFEGIRGESKCILKPPPNQQLKELLDEVGIDGIEYRNAVPDFSPTAKAQVEINYMLGGTGNYGGKARKANFDQSDQKLADQLNNSPEFAKQFGMESGNISARDIKKYREINKLTWHELNDVKTMQLVPTEINRDFGHLGGVGEINAGAFKPGGLANKKKEELLK